MFVSFQLIYLPVANVIKLYPLDIQPPDGELGDDIQARGRTFDADPPQRVLDALGTAATATAKRPGRCRAGRYSRRTSGIKRRIRSWK